MRFILFGAPGVGKGTQAKILSAKLNIPHISTGDILRESVRNKTDVGLKVKEIMNKGELVPDDIMINLIKDTLSSPKCLEGFILDGFPRTIPQVEALNHLFEELNITDYKVIYLSAEEEELVNRLANRRACKNCGNIFRLTELRDRKTCPTCNAEDSFYQRHDDEPDIVRNRFEVYERSTRPVLMYYRKMLTVHKINALQSIETVTEEILEHLGVNA